MAGQRLRFAVIPTRDRPQDFADCVAAIGSQVDSIFVVDHLSSYAQSYHGNMINVQRWHEERPNLSEMWNMGLTMARDCAEILARPYDVAVLNDDAIAPPDWFQRVSDTMHRAGASAGCVRRKFDHRMTGYAFMLNGDAGLLADEQFRWWYGDDDLQRRAEQVGGVAYAFGPDVEHRHPNSTTIGDLARIASDDKDRFEAKWRTRVR